MKKGIVFILLVGVMSLAHASEPRINDAPNIPKGMAGLLTVENMTEGQLLWLKGRVGEGTYVYVNEQNRQCTIDVPVAIGGYSETNIGIASTEGVTIAITNPTLSDLLMRGQRINSDDWVFKMMTHAESADGYILNGISEEEHFVLNSRRRWISWWLDDAPKKECL